MIFQQFELFECLGYMWFVVQTFIRVYIMHVNTDYYDGIEGMSQKRTKHPGGLYFS